MRKKYKVVTVRLTEPEYENLKSSKGDKTVSAHIKSLLAKASGGDTKEANSLVNMIKEIAESVKVSEYRLRQLEDLPDRIKANQASPETSGLDIASVQRVLDKTESALIKAVTDLKNNQLTPTFDYVSSIKAVVTDLQKSVAKICKKQGIQ